jgi:3-oxoacyl-[acyl-carrier-protein] synthase-3
MVVLGTGSYVPPLVRTNRDLEAMVDTTDEWIVTRTGIRERRIADEKTSSADLATAAARAALESSDTKPGDLDMILVATVTPDRFFPATGCTVQKNIGATRAAGFDVAAACSGFLYGLYMARGLIETGMARRILLIGVETLSKIIDWTDRSTCVLFGDGAGAVVLGPAAEGSDHGVLSTWIGSDGRAGDLLELPAGGSRIPPTHESIDARLHFVRMRGNEIFKTAVRGMEEVLRQAIDEAGYAPGDVDLFVPHQANLRMLEATASRLKVPMEKMFVNIHKYGNTSAASIPVALDEAVRGGRVKDGDLVAMVAFGGGLTWGAAVMRWGR